MKRKAFEYENEVRILFVDSLNSYKGVELISYNISVEQFADITFLADPRMGENEFSRLKAEIKDLGFHIEKSRMYDSLD